MRARLLRLTPVTAPEPTEDEAVASGWPEPTPEMPSVVAGRASVVFGAVRPGIKIGKDNHRPWLEKWRFVLHHGDRLRRYYVSDVPDTGNLDVEAWATGFFVECDHLVDWLSQDVSALGGVTEKEIRDFAESSEALQRCDAICNTHKHHTRGVPTKPTARIGDVEQSGGRWRVTVELDWLLRPNGPTIDALDLADQCVAEWRRFFKLHGTTEPS